MMMRNLRDEGFESGRERVRRLMKRMNLQVKAKRRYKVTTDSKHALPVAEDVLNSEFSPYAPNQVWATDITFVWSQQRWVYLAVVIDLYSRRLSVGRFDRRMKALVIRALMMAINLRNPPAWLIHHSDRGSQSELKESSQHWLVKTIINDPVTPLQVFSSQVLSSAGHSTSQRKALHEPDEAEGYEKQLKNHARGLILRTAFRQHQNRLCTSRSSARLREARRIFHS